MKKKGLLIILSGPSGAGKGTVLNEVRKTYKNLAVSVSVTTRAPRAGEVDGVNYHFKTIDEYKDLAHAGAFLESECVYGNYYGTLKSEVFDRIAQGIDVVLEIDVKGAFNVLGKCPEAVSIFVCPTSLEELKQRLTGRGSETADALERRLSAAMGEIKQASKYGYVVVNDDVKECADDVIAIIKAEKCSTKINDDFINKLTGGNS